MYCKIYPWLGCNSERVKYQYTIFQNDILYPYKDETRDIRSNISLCLEEFLRAKLDGTPEGEGVYFTAYTESSPNTDSISFLISLG